VAGNGASQPMSGCDSGCS